MPSDMDAVGWSLALQLLCLELGLWRHLGVLTLVLYAAQIALSWWLLVVCARCACDLPRSIPRVLVGINLAQAAFALWSLFGEPSRPC
jgi:hypothetical protein